MAKKKKGASAARSGTFTITEYRKTPRRVMNHAAKNGRAVVINARGKRSFVLVAPSPETAE